MVLGAGRKTWCGTRSWEGDLVWYWELGGRLGVVLGAGRRAWCSTSSWEEDLVW